MADNKFKMRRYDFLGTMNQGFNPFIIDDGDFIYLKNVSQDELGTLGKDGGYTIDKLLRGSGKVDRLHTNINALGVQTVLGVNNGGLYKRTGATTWDTIDASAFTADAVVSSVDYMGSAYFATPNDVVSSTNLTTVTDISADNGGSSVKGKFLEVLNGVMYLGNIIDIYTSNMVVYTNLQDHVFSNPTEENHDTYETTSHTITVDGAITGLKAYQGLLLIFTEDAVWYFNPQTLEISRLANTGAVSNDTIVEVNSVLYWANRDGVFRFNGESIPELISIPIMNWSTNALWRVIDGSAWGTMRAVDFEGKYMLAVGDLVGQMPGDDATQSGVVIVYDTYKDTWSFLTDHPVNAWTRFVNADGNQRLMFGSGDDASTYIKDYSYSYNGTAIDAVVRTKYFNFADPEAIKKLHKFYLTYRPEGETGKYITLKTAIDGSNSYVVLCDDTTANKLELDGATGTEFKLKVVSGRLREVHTVSYELSNADDGVSISILGFAQEYTTDGLDKLNMSD